MNAPIIDIECAVRTFDAQNQYCASAGAHSYAAILKGLIGEIRAGGLMHELLCHWDGLPEGAYPLRIFGALHRLALDGKAPTLAALLPTTGGIAAPHKIWPIAWDLLGTHKDFVIEYCTRPPQTNEVGRSSVLLGGFLQIANRFGQPLRLLEIGASAGLNLMWDKYRVVTDQFSWGDASATLELHPKWEGGQPPISAPITVASRAGCDRDPIDIRNTADRARLESYVWADQVHRLQRLRLACETALNTSFRLDRADAAEWLDTELQTLPKGQTTVVFHSIFRQYLSAKSEENLQVVMATAAKRATRQAPLAWLSMEVPDIRTAPQLMLTTWPDGEAKTLASAHHHGEWIKWGG